MARKHSRQNSGSSHQRPPSAAASSDEDIPMFEAALVELEQGQEVVEKKFSVAEESLTANFAALEALLSESKRQNRDADALFRLMKDIDPNLSPEQRDLFQVRLATVRSRLKRSKDMEPHRGTCFWRLFLGEGANIKLWRRSELFEVKDCYNRFRSNSVIVFVLFPLIELVFSANRFMMLSHQVWLLYFYVSLSLRESLLLCNGSRIEQWWIVHHYIAAGLCICNLTWSDGPGYRFFMNYFAALTLWQGVVMFMQSQYQNRRHYVRTSLGKTCDMDIPAPETLVEKPTDLMVLVPLLFMTYAGQIFTGFTLVFKSSQWPGSFWNLIANGLLVLLLGIGNCIATFKVLKKKRKERHLERRRRSQ